MNRAEALKTLGLEADASDEDAKKAFKKLVVKYHPDTNKDEDASRKLQEVNQAYKAVVDPAPQPQFPQGRQTVWNINPNPQHKKHFIRGNIEVPLTFTFTESVLGCKKSFMVAKYIACDACHGMGTKTQDSVLCPTCNGARQRVTQRGVVHVVETCGSCVGPGVKVDNCDVCKGESSVIKDTNMTVSIDGGLLPERLIRLRGGGHYQTDPMFGAVITDLYIRPQIEPEPNMKISGMNVISTLELGLLEAVEGCTKKVKTVNGNVELKVPKKSRNKDEVLVKGAGVPPHGNHVFVLDVRYPEPINEFVRKLKGD